MVYSHQDAKANAAKGLQIPKTIDWETNDISNGIPQHVLNHEGK